MNVAIPDPCLSGRTEAHTCRIRLDCARKTQDCRRQKRRTRTGSAVECLPTFKAFIKLLKLELILAVHRTKKTRSIQLFKKDKRGGVVGRGAKGSVMPC